MREGSLGFCSAGRAGGEGPPGNLITNKALGLEGAALHSDTTTHTAPPAPASPGVHTGSQAEKPCLKKPKCKSSERGRKQETTD